MVEWNFFFELRHEVGPFGPRADKAHLAHENVDHLRDLVDSQLPQHSADARDAGVVFRSPHRTAAALGIARHRPEFVKLEDSLVLPHALLAVEDGARGIQFNGDGGDERDRRGKNQSKQRNDDIDDALQEENQAAAAKALGKDDPARLEIRDGNLTQHALVEIMAVLNRHAAQAQHYQVLGWKIDAAFRPLNEYFAHLLGLDDLDRGVMRKNRHADTHRVAVGEGDAAGLMRNEADDLHAEVLAAVHLLGDELADRLLADNQQLSVDLALPEEGNKLDAMDRRERDVPHRRPRYHVTQGAKQQTRDSESAEQADCPIPSGQSVVDRVKIGVIKHHDDEDSDNKPLRNVVEPERSPADLAGVQQIPADDGHENRHQQVHDRQQNVITGIVPVKEPHDALRLFR